MRISIPTISLDPLAKVLPQLPREQAVRKLSEFLAPGNTTVLTGAGVSVDSGIRAYRGENGRYLNPNYHPIFYQELVDPTAKGHSFRQRYWARSYLGWRFIRMVEANPTHFALSALQYTNSVRHLITQNVDGLHVRASPRPWGSIERDRRILELHGRLRSVSCTHGHSFPRTSFQDTISKLNPSWKEYADEMAANGSEPRTNPDGDVQLERSYDDFVVPECPECVKEGHNSHVASIMKPDVIFFGESISSQVKERSFQNVEDSDRLLVIGTTLATYSAFRIVKHAVELKKPVMLLNVGPTRADTLKEIEKIEWKSGDVLREVCTTIFGARVQRDPELKRLLTSGVIQPPLDDTEDS